MGALRDEIKDFTNVVCYKKDICPILYVVFAYIDNKSDLNNKNIVDIITKADENIIIFASVIDICKSSM